MNKEEMMSPKEVTHHMIVTTQMHRRVLENNLDGTGIHRAQHRVLITLATPSFASQVELAKYLEVSPATIAVSLKSLKKSGLITKTTKEEDNRINFVELTEAGRKVVEESCEFFDQLDYEMYRGFSMEEMRQLCSYFDRMYKNMKRLSKKNTDNGGKQKI